MIDISSITNMISALRAQTSPNSITPEGLGSILQKITNLIGSLSQVPEQDATDLVARMTQCESDSRTALQTARSAQATADGNVIDVVGYEQTATGVTVTVKQHSGNSNSATIPSATTTLAGVMSAEDKDHLDKAYQRTMASLTTSSTETQVKLNYKRHNNQVTTVTLVGASSSAAGLMTAADKVKLDSLATTVENFTQQLNSVANVKADRDLNGLISMLKLDQWPRTVIKSMTPGFSSEEGEVYLNTGMMAFDPVMLYVRVGNTHYTLGEPSEHVVYFARDTKKFCIWNKDQQIMEEI